MPQPAASEQEEPDAEEATAGRVQESTSRSQVLTTRA